MIATIWPGLDGLRGRRGDVRVDVADRDRDALGQAGPARRPRRSAPPARSPSWPIGCVELVGDEAGEAGVQRGRGSPASGSAPSWQDALVAGGAGVADVAARTAARRSSRPPRPSARIAVVDLGVLLEQLQALGELPLRGDQPAVAGAATARRARAASALIRSACRCAAWCFHSFT